MSSNESRKGTIDESDHIDISNCDQFPQHSSQKAFEPIDLNIGVGIDEAVDGADKSHSTNDKKERIHWSVEEEIVLAESWASISND